MNYPETLRDGGPVGSPSQVTPEFRVDQYDRVYDAGGVFYCTWDQLSEDEQAKVKLNPMSAR